MKNKILSLGFTGLVLLSSCDPLKRIKFNQLPQSVLPNEMKSGRLYLKDISGGIWINHPEDIPGTKLYVYYFDDSTYTYPSSRTYPQKVKEKVTLNSTPHIRVNGKAVITNSNDFGLFLSAFNLQNNLTTEKAADLVITDFNEATVEGQYFQDSLSKIKLNDTTEFIIGEDGKAILPNEIYYVRGVNITTVALTMADKITNSSQVTATVFKMNNSVFSSAATSTSDYKIGLTVTTLFKQPTSHKKTIEVLNDKSVALNPFRSPQQKQKLIHQHLQQLKHLQEQQKQQQQQQQQQIKQQIQQQM
ncbi:MAG: hypothetical protein NTX03_09650 [Bacteroidetes bacterium]|nr:hypothetical protein [Bacteroidota bacterium]